ncbi:MAG: O-antigen ligase family protein [Nitrospira sp.]|nr:O-antigen ligase family protein [Nitrospira sp.]
MPELIAFIGWLALLIIVQTLALRPNFLHHFALVALVIGIASLPYLNVRSVGGVVRAWASGTGISNPNVLGMWFGFCTVYFLFWGFQCRTFVWRAASWGVAVGSFYIVTLTVSRAPLLGIALACIVGFRSALKRSFVPVVSFVLVLCLIYVSGVFDEELGQYASRGIEESGRGRLWPAAVERIFNSPWVGVGLDDIRIRTRSGKEMNPHNPVLHIALGAGLIPVICFLGYLVRVGFGVRGMMQRVQVGEASLLLPLVAFGMFELMMLDMAFMSPWVVVIFGLVAGRFEARDPR